MLLSKLGNLAAAISPNTPAPHTPNALAALACRRKLPAPRPSFVLSCIFAGFIVNPPPTHKTHTQPTLPRLALSLTSLFPPHSATEGWPASRRTCSSASSRTCRGWVGLGLQGLVQKDWYRREVGKRACPLSPCHNQRVYVCTHQLPPFLLALPSPRPRKTHTHTCALPPPRHHLSLVLTSSLKSRVLG